jgi:hypothetical protein
MNQSVEIGPSESDPQAVAIVTSVAFVMVIPPIALLITPMALPIFFALVAITVDTDPKVPRVMIPRMC